MDIQTTANVIKWTIDIITIILMLVAVSRAIKKKNNMAFAAALLGNLLVYYFTESPLLCWIVSIAVIIWVAKAKNKEVIKQTSKPISKQSLKSSNYSNNLENTKKMVKPGPIIGLILGILMAGFPIIGFMTHEASLSDPQGQMIGYGFIIVGAIFVVVNIIVLATGKENLLAGSENNSQSSPIPLAHVKAEDDSSAKFAQNMIRCRFCGKRYSSEYNGCPHCKKK